jgi:outer membrane protein OmpA-like peptidoglycan-associated protein
MKTFSLCTLAAATLLACAGEERIPAQTSLSSAASEQTKMDWPVFGRGAARFIRIDLGPDTFADCRRISPKFPFDSATTYAQDRAQVAAFAACLNTPEMRDRTLLLVGRTDERGPDEYNEALGLKRAHAIRLILIESGISEKRIEITSEGEKAAVGARQEYSQGYDRRVDVIVKGGVHQP